MVLLTFNERNQSSYKKVSDVPQAAVNVAYIETDLGLMVASATEKGMYVRVCRL